MTIEKNYFFSPVRNLVFMIQFLLIVVSGNTYADNNEFHHEVNLQLDTFQKETFKKPELKKIGSRVTMAFSYDYSNFTFIEGEDGVIVVDTGFYTNNAKHALDDYRKLVSKPITAIIYTHVHNDHRGGSPVFMKQAQSDIPVIAPKGWQERHDYDTSPLRPMIVKRGLSQFGMLLPDGKEGTVGTGIGPITHMNGQSLFVLPNQTILDKTTINISGIEMQLIPLPGDIESHMMVWLPKEKVLISGDLLGGTLPFIATARFEADRKAESFVNGLNTILDYDADYLIPGHGRALLSSNDIIDVVTANRDVTEYLLDQVTRYIAQGKSVDYIIDVLKLPPYLENHKDLQPHYHRLEWLIRGLYLKRAGWVSDTLSLVQLTKSEQAKRLIKLLGGTSAVLEAAKKSIEEQDYRWAIQLADYIWTIDSTNQESVEILIDGYRNIANITMSANERNFSLTEVKSLSGNLPWNKFLAKSTFVNQKNLSNEKLLTFLKYRYKPEMNYGYSGHILIHVDGDDSRYLVNIVNGVLRVVQTDQVDIKDKVVISHLQLRKVVSGLATFSGLLKANAIEIEGDNARIETLFSML